ncbi:MAG: hypothetical protein AB7S81_02065 [Bdellovibrionales bacterium]
MTDLNQFMTEAKEGRSPSTGRTTSGMVVGKAPDTFVLTSGQVLQIKRCDDGQLSPVVRPATPVEQSLFENGQRHFHSSDVDALIAKRKEAFQAYIKEARQRQHDDVDRPTVQMPCSPSGRFSKLEL